MAKVLMVIFLLAFVSNVAGAGNLTCPKGESLSSDSRRCSGGGLPMFEANSPVPNKPKRQDLVDKGDIRYFFRGWALFVPGTAYVVPNGLMNYDSIIVSAGTGVLHRLQINSNHTFKWDGQIGHWSLTNEGMSGYPIKLSNAYEGRDWRVGVNPKDGGIYVVDGYTWFQAKE